MSDDNKKHLLQKHGILPEFDIVSQTSLSEFMSTYDAVVNTSDDIKELANVSKILNATETDIPGYIDSQTVNATDNPELNKLAYAIIEFMMQKATDPKDWAYLLTYIIHKLNLEIGESDSDHDDQ